MSSNPYQSPEIVAEPVECRSARRWVAAPAFGIWIAGALYLGCGVVSLILMVIAWGTIAYDSTLSTASDATEVLQRFMAKNVSLAGLAIAIAVVGWLAMSCSRRLHRLDSKHAAVAACLLAVIMYPLCIVTLPLGIWGLIMLRRADVQRELSRNTRPAEREQGTVTVDRE